MSIVQWLLLILVIAVVAGAYWYLRNQSGTDPWQGMDDAEDEPADTRGESLGGDSYIIGVRNLSADDPAARRAPPRAAEHDHPGDQAGHTQVPDAMAERSWAVYKNPEADEASPGYAEPAPPRAVPPDTTPAYDDAPEAGPPRQAAPPAEAQAEPGPPPSFAAHLATPPAGQENDAGRADYQQPHGRPLHDTGPAPAQPAPPTESTPQAADNNSSGQQQAAPVPDSAPAARGATAAPAAARVHNMRPQRVPTEEQSVFILHVASADGGFFKGPDIHAVLAQQQLKYGLNDIYHRVTEIHGVPESVFAVADMLKPGLLDPDQQDQLATPGLTLFLVLPGPTEGVPAMRDMMVTANAIAQAMGGEVLDDKRTRLKAQSAQYMLDQIAELDRRARITNRR